MRPSPRHLRLLARTVVAALLLVGAVRVTFFTVYRVAGTSMLEALQDGDRILVSDLVWLHGAAEPGDTVVFEIDGEVLVKRVMAGPGDRIALLAGTVLRNGEVVSEQIPSERNRAVDLVEHHLGDHEYFVMGDHRAVSVDSRDFGPIQEQQLLGQVLLRMAGDGVSTVAALTR